MSDCTGSRYDKKEDFQILLTKNDHGGSPQHTNYLWMARWTKASGSAENQNEKSCNRLEDLNKGTSTKDSGYGFMKSSVTERLTVGVGHGSASVKHTRQFISNMRAHVCKELGPEYGGESFEIGMNRKALNLRAREAVSETYPARKPLDLTLDFQKVSSENPSSDWSQFPMFEINRKIGNILNPKRRSSLGPASLNVHMATPHVMALSSQEHRMHSHRITDMNMDIWKNTGGIVSHLEDPFGHMLKGQLSDTMSCSCSKDDNKSSDCQVEELPCASTGKEFHFAGNNMDQIAASAFHNQKSRSSAVYKQQDAARAIFCAPVLGTEFQKEPTNHSNTSNQNGNNFDGTLKSHGKAVSSLPYEQQHLKTNRMESAVYLNASCMVPDPVANTLTVNSKHLTHGKEPTEKSEGSCKRKGPCLYEMLTTDPKSQGACPKNSSSGNGFDVYMYGTNIGSRLFGKQNQSSARTETFYSDTLASKSMAGIASSPAQKDYGYPNEAKTAQLEIAFARGGSDSKENRIHSVNGLHDASSKATIASNHSCIPGTGSTNLDLILFQMSRLKNSISSGIAQPPIGAEPSDRWLKRLRLDISDPEISCSKRSKGRDGPPLEETNCMFGMALRCNSREDEEKMDRVNEEDKVLAEERKLKDSKEIHPFPAKTMNFWIGRWCQGGTPVFHGDPNQGRKDTKFDQASDELGGQFPSIAAMAMMGRAMNKLRPSEHQKKGPFVVWKTE